MANDLEKLIFGEDTNITVGREFLTTFELQLLQKYNPSACDHAKAAIKRLISETTDKFQGLPYALKSSVIQGQASVTDMGKIYAVSRLFDSITMAEFIVFLTHYSEWAKFNGEPSFVKLEECANESPAETLNRMMESDN